MSSKLEGQISHPSSDGVVFGVGACRRHLGELLERTSIHRALLVTTPSVARSPLLSTVRESAGRRLVGEFTGSKAQSPKSVVLEVVEQARETRTDGFISLGGSSVVDVTKGAALVLAEGENLDRFLASAAGPADLAHPSSPRLPHIALPTTLSGAEYSPYAGITDEAKREKRVYFDKGLAPRWVLLDAELSLHTPTALWAGTGMKLLADCVEEICSPRSNPYTDALALAALKTVFHELLPSVASPPDCELRERILFASFMSAMNFSSTSLGLVAALRHPLGARGVAHGVASTIVLPHVLNWNMSWVKDKLAQVNAGLTPDTTSESPYTGAEQFVRAIESLIRRLELPARLRDVGIEQDDFGAIAEHASHSFTVATNPRPVENPSALVEVLENAW